MKDNKKECTCNTAESISGDHYYRTTYQPCPVCTPVCPCCGRPIGMWPAPWPFWGPYYYVTGDNTNDYPQQFTVTITNQ